MAKCEECEEIINIFYLNFIIKVIVHTIFFGIEASAE